MANTIRAQREAKGIPRRTLALAAGMNERTLERWESDNPPAMSPRLLRKLAKALGVTVDELRDDPPAH